MDTIHPYFHDNTPARLDEVTYKDIMAEINPNNLPHRDYAPLIKYVKYVGIKGNTMTFFVPNKYNGWNTYIQFPSWKEHIGDTSLSSPDLAKLLLWTDNIHVHCDCPAFIFWGSQYILTQLDAAIYPEDRFPHIRNPLLKGIVCKHLNRTIKVLPFYLGDMAASIKEQRRELVAKGLISPGGQES